MVEPGQLNVRIICGDTLRLPLTITDTDTGDAVDLTGETFTCDIRDSPGGTLVQTVTVEETDLTAGQIDLVVTDDETALLTDQDIGTLWIRLRATDADGETTTWAEGKVTITL